MLSNQTKQAMQDLGILWEKISSMCDKFRLILKNGIKSRDDEEYAKLAVSLIVIQCQINNKIADDLGLENPALSDNDKKYHFRLLMENEKNLNTLCDLMRRLDKTFGD